MSGQSTGSVVGGVIGGVIGYFAGGNVALGYAIGSSIGGYVTAPDVQTHGPRLTDNQTTQSSYGVAIPKIYGGKSTAEIRIWSGGLIEHEHEEDVGKGGPSNTHVTYSYEASWACLLCEGEIDSIRRIWFDGNLVYDKSANSTVEGYAASGEVSGRMKIYYGTETQGVDPTIEASVGVGNASAYRGWAYVVFTNADVTKYGHIPFVEFDVIESVSSADYVLPDLFEDRPNFSEDRDGYGYVGDGIIEFVDVTDVIRLKPSDPIGTAYHELRDLYGRVIKTFETVLNDVSTEVTSYEAPVRTSTPSIDLRYNAVTSGRWVGYLQPDRHVAVSNSVGFSAVTDSGSHILGESATATYHNGLTYLLLGPKQNELARIIAVDDLNRVVGSYTHDNDFSDFTIADDGFIYAVSPVHAGFDSEIVKLNPGDLSLIRIYASAVVAFDGWVSASINVSGRVPRAVLSKPLSGTYWVCDLEDDDSITLVATGTATGTTLVARGVVYEDMLLTHTGYWVTPSYNEAGSVLLSDVVSGLCANAGLVAADYDVTDLAGVTVAGYGVGRQMSVRAAIQPLQQAYFFDAAEIGGKIEFIMRGGAAVASLTADDLGAHQEGGESPPRLTISRGSDKELPRRVSVNYLKPETFEVGSQHDSRQAAIDSETEITLELPLVLTDDQAAQIAEVNLFGGWQSRERVQFSVIDTSLAPTNVITVSDEEQAYTLRLVSVDYAGAIGPVQCEAVIEDTSIYNSVSVGAPSTSGDQTLTMDGPTQLAIIDGSLLASVDSDDGIYLAAAGYYSGWSGCVVLRSQDDANWSQWVSITTAATMGRADTVLGSASPAVTDKTNTLTVTLTSGSLSSVTEAAMLNGANAALVGDEVIAFQTATLVTGDTWTISTLVRGARGTEWAIDTHSIGDRFVLLTAASLVRASLSSDVIGTTQYLRAVTIGQSLESGTGYQFSYAGNGYRCWSPWHLQAVDNLDGTFTATWFRRVRKRGEWLDYVDVPQIEDAINYRVQVWRAGVQQSTADVTTELATVTALTGDKLRVAQLSAVVGAGTYKEITL